MILTLLIIHNLYTTSIGYTLAFPQAEVETTIYMDIQLGCEVPEGDFAYLLFQNLYDWKQGAKIWSECLRDNLVASEESRGYGFQQSVIDPCIFYKEGVILISWADNCLIFVKQKELVDQLIADLNRNFSHTEEDDVSAFLGVQVEIDKNTDKISLNQPCLIQRIIGSLRAVVKDANGEKAIMEL